MHIPLYNLLIISSSRLTFSLMLRFISTTSLQKIKRQQKIISQTMNSGLQQNVQNFKRIFLFLFSIFGNCNESHYFFKQKSSPKISFYRNQNWSFFEKIKKFSHYKKIQIVLILCCTIFFKKKVHKVTLSSNSMCQRLLYHILFDRTYSFLFIND